MTKPKRCPFCGGRAYVQFSFYETAEVVCSECGAKGPGACMFDIEERAVEAWNRRVSGWRWLKNILNENPYSNRYAPKG